MTPSLRLVLDRRPDIYADDFVKKKWPEAERAKLYMDVPFDEASQKFMATMFDIRDEWKPTHWGHLGSGRAHFLRVWHWRHHNRDTLTYLPHPTAHLDGPNEAKMATWMLSKPPWIVFTHSELFCLRILSQVRHGVTNPDDVEFYVLLRQGDEGKASGLWMMDAAINDLPPYVQPKVTPDGDFDMNWPYGFFTERMREIF